MDPNMKTLMKLPWLLVPALVTAAVVRAAAVPAAKSDRGVGPMDQLTFVLP